MKLKDVMKIKIGNVTFDIVKNDYFDYSEKNIYNNNGVELRHCYSNYSHAIESVYNEWRDWFVNNLDVLCCFGIQSYNCMIFTLGCKYADINKNISGIIHITPCNNTLSIRTELYDKFKNEVYKIKKQITQTIKQYKYFSDKELKIILKNEIEYILSQYYMRLPKEIIINVCNTIINELT